MHISELYAAGIGFSIVDDDADFDDSGELSHCHTLVDDDYVAFDGSGEARSGLADINELRDDAARWQHLRDAHLSERVAELQTLCQSDKLWDSEGRKLPEYGEMSFYALDRKRRYQRLRRYLQRLPVAKRAAVRSEIWRRYRDSVALAAKRQEWYLVALTKQQANSLMHG
jgi:hypothetical protein